MHVLARSGFVLLSGTALALTGIAPGVADPPNGFHVPLVCDDGASYDVVTNGNGAFTPAHDTASTRTFIPTAFGEFHGTVTDSSGTVIDKFTDPAIAKGSSDKARRTSIACTFSVTETFDDPDLGLITFHGEGSVTGFTTPAR